MSTKSISGGSHAQNVPDDVASSAEAGNISENEEVDVSDDEDISASSETDISGEDLSNGDDESAGFEDMKGVSVAGKDGKKTPSVENEKRPKNLIEINAEDAEEYKFLQNNTPPEEVPPELGGEVGNIILKV
jgi:hypothetical protein